MTRPAGRCSWPRPCPPAAARPRALSISDFATLMADPYAIYARKVLNINEVPGLDEESDPAMFGEIVHAGLAAYFADPAAGGLNLALQNAMRQLRPRAALENWWSARLERIAEWMLETEAARQAELGAPLALGLEVKGELAVPGGFTLKARADRIERNAGGVAIFDYKTGKAPSSAKVEDGSAPQLPLEAVMAQAGAFGAALQGSVTEMAFLKLSGRAEAGEERTLFAGKPDALRAVIEHAAAALPALFARFAQAETPYLAAPHPGRPNEYDVYAGVSRRAEWAGEEA
jgi:ATP-dependent helicase/nuclease subunit B